MTSKIMTGVLAGGLAIVAMTGAASAASVTFSNFTSNDEQQLNPTVTVTETGAGMFDVSIAALTSPEAGFLTGFYLGTTGDVQCSSVSITAPTSTRNCYNNPGATPNNANLNGLVGNDEYASLFDFGVELETSNGRRADRFTSAEFPATILKITDASLTLADFTQIGLRFQGVTFADGSTGSDKLIGGPDMPPPNEVPLPAAGFMLLAGLGGLAATRRRKA